MPHLAVNASREAVLSGVGALGPAFACLPPRAPVIVMVHGYGYDPARPGRSPHPRLFGGPRGWAARLGAGTGESAPLCIGFGWSSRGTVWRAWAEGARAAAPLAGLISRIAARGHRVHLIAHSMGARVALHGLALAPSDSVGRAVLMTGAALRSDARRALASPAGRRAEVINVTSRENDIFDAAVELVTGWTGRSIGDGLGRPRANWLDLQIDAPAARVGMARLGYALAAPAARICHDSAHARPGMFDLYRDLLTDPPRLPLSALRDVLPREGEPRWSRLLARTALPEPAPPRDVAT